MLKSNDLKLIKLENAIDEHGNGKGTNSVLKFSLVSELLQSVFSVLFNFTSDHGVLLLTVSC